MDEEQIKQSAFPARISKEEINDLPLARYEGPVRLIRTLEDMESAAEELSKETILGFDTETRPSFRKGQVFPPALLQLAGAEMVYIVQLLQVGSLDVLLPVLSSKHIVKAGVALQRDVKELRDMTEFQPGGFKELSTFSDEIGVESNGLRALAAILLGIRVSKGARLTNWSEPNLKPEQIAYAATDAWVSRNLYLTINKAFEQSAEPADGIPS